MQLARAASRFLHALDWRINSLLQRPAVDRPSESTDEAIRSRMRQYDMVASVDEQFYAQQYLQWIKALIPSVNAGGAAVLDAGCGQGRLTLALASAMPGSRIIGVDLSPEAIERAREYARRAGLSNVEFHAADVRSYLRTAADESVDLVVCTELAFWFPGYPALVRDFHRLLKAGGSLAISFWSEYALLLKFVQARQWETARRVLGAREGRLSDGPITFTWLTPAEARQFLQDSGFAVERMVGIGTCSGIGEVGDALSTIAQPSRLSGEDAAELMSIETTAGERYPENGRYILGLARKISTP